MDSKIGATEYSFEDSLLTCGGQYIQDDKNCSTIQFIRYNTFPNFNEQNNSILRKVLTEELFQAYKNVVSCKGYSFSNVIMSGIVNSDLEIGVDAGCEDCWKIFKNLYYPIVLQWHGFNAATQCQISDTDYSKLILSNDNLEVLSKYVKSCRVRASRNISGFALPPGTLVSERVAVESILVSVFSRLPEEFQGDYIRIRDMTDDICDVLIKSGYLFQNPVSSKSNDWRRAFARQWPDNRGLFMSRDRRTLCWVNEEDHCRVICMESGADMITVFQRFVRFENCIQVLLQEAGYKFMWDDHLGYLGSCPTNIGTGLRASVMVSLPNLFQLSGSNQKSKDSVIYQACLQVGLQVRGSDGENTPAVDGKYDLSNKQRIGLTEVEAVQRVIDGVLKIIQCEALAEHCSRAEEIVNYAKNL